MAYCTWSHERSMTLLTHHIKTEFFIHLSPVALSVCSTPISPIAQTTNPEAVLTSSLSTIQISNQPPSPVNSVSYRFLQSIHVHSSPQSLLPWFRSLGFAHVMGGAVRWRCPLGSWTFRSGVWKKETLLCEDHGSRVGPLETCPLKEQAGRWFGLRRHYQRAKMCQDNIVT